MRVNVLGTLQTTINGVSVVPTALKAKKLFALAILNRGRVVQFSAIERELWGLDAPPSVATGVQNSVMQIRKSIAAALDGDDSCRAAKHMLITEPTGYRFEFPSDDFDLSRYRQLVTAADDAAQRGDIEQASESLTCALRLWRDKPIADIPAGPVLRSHVHRLEEDRRNVLCRRVAIDLRLSRFSEVIGELQAWTMLNPYDEMLHKYLMLALHQSGRRNDALKVYRDLRDALADDIGLEPSQELQALQRGILTAEAAELDPAVAQLAVPGRITD